MHDGAPVTLDGLSEAAAHARYLRLRFWDNVEQPKSWLKISLQQILLYKFLEGSQASEPQDETLQELWQASDQNASSTFLVDSRANAGTSALEQPYADIPLAHKKNSVET